MSDKEQKLEWIIKDQYCPSCTEKTDLEYFFFYRNAYNRLILMYKSDCCETYHSGLEIKTFNDGLKTSN